MNCKSGSVDYTSSLKYSKFHFGTLQTQQFVNWCNQKDSWGNSVKCNWSYCTLDKLFFINITYIYSLFKLSCLNRNNTLLKNVCLFLLNCLFQLLLAPTPFVIGIPASFLMFKKNFRYVLICFYLYICVHLSFHGCLPIIYLSTHLGLGCPYLNIDLTLHLPLHSTLG